MQAIWIHACPSVDALGLYAAGDGSHRSQITAHLDVCPSCRVAVAAAARSSRPELARGSVDWLDVPPGPAITATDDDEIEVVWTSAGSGNRIGRYILRERLGEGAMGTVHLAYDPELRRHVALKLLHPSTEAPDAGERLLVEAQAAAQLSHPNTVTVFDAGLHEGQPYVAMELVEGETAAEWLRRAPSWLEGLELMLRAGEGLWAAHRAGLVHRDFKLGNILVGPAGVVKVSDFGLARFSDETLRQIAAHEEALALPVSSRAPTSQGFLGTPAYTAPELYAGETATAASDQFAFAVALYRVLYGVRPFRGATLYAVYDAICYASPPPPPEESDVPAAIWPVIARALAKDPRARHPTLGDLLDGVRAAMGPRRRAESDRCPFPGLASFDELDASVYFGRSRELAEACGRLRQHGIVAIVGPSGTGKSSFVRALLVPTLRGCEGGCDLITIRPGARPLHALALALSPVSLEDGVDDVDALAEWLRAEPERIVALLRTRARRNASSVFLFVDQLEELYTQTGDVTERRAFAAVLAAIAGAGRSELRLLLSIRSDFVERVAECGPLMDRVLDGFVFLGPPGRIALTDALTGPLEQTGYSLEDPSIALDIAQQLEGQPGAFPLLQFIAGQLWESRDQARRVITRASVHAIGSLADSLARHAEHVLKVLSISEGAVARRVLLRLVTAERTRARVATSELTRLAPTPADLQRVVELLVRERLLVMDGQTIELVHETLIGHWPTLKGWLDDERGEAKLVGEVSVAARQWDAAGRPEGYLWTGTPARRVMSLDEDSLDLSACESAFVRATRRLFERGTRRRRMVRAAFVIALALVATLASTGLVVVERANESALRSAEMAHAEQTKAETTASELRARLEEIEQLHTQYGQLEASSRTELQRYIEALKSERAQLRLANENLLARGRERELLVRELTARATELKVTRDRLEAESLRTQALLVERAEIIQRLKSDVARLTALLPASDMKGTR